MSDSSTNTNLLIAAVVILAVILFIMLVVIYVKWKNSKKDHLLLRDENLFKSQK